MPEREVRFFSHMEILPLGKGTQSLKPWPVESLKGENGSTSWKKSRPMDWTDMLGGRDSKRLSVLLGLMEAGNALGFIGCSGQKRASIPLSSPQESGDH